MANLDEILSNKPKVEAPVEKPEPKPEPEVKPEVEAKPRDETGKFVKGEKATETPPVKESKTEKPDDTPESGLKAGITAERRKRQEAERRAQDLEARLAAINQPKPQIPDVLENPQGYAKHLKDEVQAQILNERVNLSVDLSRDRHDDFDDVMGENMANWTDALQKEPGLYSWATAQRNPGEWAYQHLKREKFLEKVGNDPDAWTKQRETEIRTQVEAEIKQKLEQAAANRPPVPTPSLASASSGGRISEPTWSGPSSLDQILKRK